VVDPQGRVRDLGAHCRDITPETLSQANLARLAALDPDSLPLAPEGARLGVPVNGVRKFPAIGLNYADHAAEANLPAPAEPVYFFKTVTSLNGPNDEIMLPRDASKGDWEIELGVVIGKTARYVDVESALDHVAGYLIVNDVSERAFQKERGSQWAKGKGCDTFGPVGPWLVTPDEVGDPQALDMWLELNGERMQTGNTRTMIFGVAELIAYCSRFFTLEPGDILTTGTPPGVGEGRKPDPVYLKPGDVMRLGIEKLGEQQQRVVAWRPMTEVAA
jgi:2-keto-4-pentenoate hydratase/2-oxohepta-3-ene-1,7-dioic acid hydratase in catechol pathway